MEKNQGCRQAAQDIPSVQEGYLFTGLTSMAKQSELKIAINEWIWTHGKSSLTLGEADCLACKVFDLLLPFMNIGGAMPDLQSRITQIRARLDAATPGKWRAFRAVSSICVEANEPIERIEDVGASMFVEVFGDKKVENAQCIAHAPADLRYLLRVVDAVLSRSESWLAHSWLSDYSRGYVAALSEMREEIDHIAKEAGDE